MYCWGNMKNGELGLGGLEEEIISKPRHHPFVGVDNVTEGEFDHGNRSFNPDEYLC